MPSRPRYVLEALNEHHPIRQFSCGDSDLDEYIRDFALDDCTRDLARTFVEIDQSKPVTGNVAGFFTLRAHALSIEPAYFTDWDSEVDGDEPIEVPLAELMYLARDEQWTGQGIGDTLMIDALKTVASASERLGLIGLHLRSTESGVRLYERFDFKPFREHPTYDRARYILPIGDIRTIVDSIEES